MRNLNLYRSLLAYDHWESHRESLPHSVARWLMHTQSLTAKMKMICHCFQVEIINEMWHSNNTNERQWVREVVLKCHDTDWIFAQTIVPENTINNVAQIIPVLGENPVGLWLFPQNPQRQSLEWQQDNQTGLYSRRSILHLKGYPIEIKELFLTDFPFEK